MSGEGSLVTATEERALARGRTTVMVALFVGYTAFYLCRSNLEAALPLLKREGFDEDQLGLVASVATMSYAIGKVVLGTAGDVVGGRRIMLVACFGSVAATFGIGLFAHGLAALVVLAAANRFFQSGAWGGLVHVVSRWFPSARHGSVMGILSMSYDAGNIVTLLFCGALVEAHFGWRDLFLFNPAILAAVGLFLALRLRGTPPGADEPAKADAKPKEPRPPLREVLPWLAKKPAFWMTVALSFLLTFVRSGFMTWTPLYLTEVATAAGSTSPIGGSIAKGAAFSIAGMIASLVIGRISDRFGPGRRAPVMIASLFVLVLAIVLLAHVPIHDPWVAAGLIAVCGLFLLGPYSMLAGALTLDVAGTRGTATATGIVDGVGYLGGSLAGVAIGAIKKRLGWSAAFDLVATGAFVATLVAVGWSVFSARRRAREVS
jgi:sugar phosphate permease